MSQLFLVKTLLGAPVLCGFFAFSYGIVMLGVKLGLVAPKKRQPPAPPPVQKPPKPEKVYYLIENAPTRPRTPKLKARRVYFSDEKPTVSFPPESR